MASSPSDSVDFRLEAHRWEHRLLIVFAPSATAEPLTTQKNQLEGQGDGFRDRDLLLVTAIDASEGTMRLEPGADPKVLTEAAVRRLYKQFGVPADAFRVLLVGKGGTEKRRAAKPVTARSVFDTIDAMPMRQEEVRQSLEGREDA